MTEFTKSWFDITLKDEFAYSVLTVWIWYSMLFLCLTLCRVRKKILRTSICLIGNIWNKYTALTKSPLLNMMSISICQKRSTGIEDRFLNEKWWSKLEFISFSSNTMETNSFPGTELKIHVSMTNRGIPEQWLSKRHIE